MNPAPVDDIDLELLSLLQGDARRRAAEMAERLGLSATATSRRIARLERLGVIEGYTTRVDFSRLGWTIEAFIELRFSGTTGPDEMDETVVSLPEVAAMFTVSGNYDALVRLRVRSVDHLREVIAKLRSRKRIVDTRTHIVLASYVNPAWDPRATNR